MYGASGVKCIPPFKNTGLLIEVWARIDDVFMRESPTNLYEVHVMYHSDSRQSRLRPKHRVGRLKFIVDRPGNYRETLADLPEAKAICKGGCSSVRIEGFLCVSRRVSDPRIPHKTQR